MDSKVTQYREGSSGLSLDPVITQITPDSFSLLADSSKAWLLEQLRTFSQLLPQFIIQPFIPNLFFHDTVYGTMNLFSLTYRQNFQLVFLGIFADFAMTNFLVFVCPVQLVQKSQAGLSATAPSCNLQCHPSSISTWMGLSSWYHLTLEGYTSFRYIE